MPYGVRRPSTSDVNHSLIDSVAGAIQVASIAMTEAKVGDLMGIIASAIFGGLLGGAAGCAAGAVNRAPIDQVLPDIFRCQACDFVFDGDRTNQALT